MLYSWRDLVARNQGTLSNSPGKGCSLARLNYRSYHIRARINRVRLLAAPASTCSFALDRIGGTGARRLHHLFRSPAGTGQPKEADRGGVWIGAGHHRGVLHVTGAALGAAGGRQLLPHDSVHTSVLAPLDDLRRPDRG